MSKALIVGGGIAGTVTAIALRKAGIDATVYEAYDRNADGVGAYVTLAVNGLDALRCVGLDQLVREHSFDTPRMAFQLGSGRKIGEIPLGGVLADGTPYQTVKRADLYRRLREEAARLGIEVRYGKRLVDAKNAADGVSARFDDGTTASGDLLIGADGLRSRTRTIIDPAAPTARYVPLLNTGGYAHGLSLNVNPGTMNMIFGKRVFFSYFAHPNGEMWWFANPPRRTEPSAAELAAISPAQWRQELIRLVSVDKTPAVDIINATDTIFPPWHTYDFPIVPTWHRGRMIIIGDAAHAVSPTAGQGAAIAIEDAVVLAKCLRDIHDGPAAFEVYERLRRERVERVVEHGKTGGEDKIIGPVTRVIRDKIMTSKFKNVSVDPDNAPDRWIWDHHIAWDELVSAR